MRHTILKLNLPTAAGVFRAELRNGKLAALEFPRTRRARVLSVPREGRRLAKELEEYFAGKRTGFASPVDRSAGTRFQRKVWAALQRIPYGRTKSYGQVARAIGAPAAFRAVGSACGKNPVPILVPCHRVVAQNEKLGGFSAGLHWKKRLLALERTRA